MVQKQQTRSHQPILYSGARVFIVAPCGPVPEDSFKKGCEVLRNWGLELVFSEGLEDRHRYLAGTDEDRLVRLKTALAEEDIQCIWMARGGYGATRILQDLMTVDTISPPPLIGFSDGTALHAAYRHWDALSLHGPVITQLGRLSLHSLETCHQFLFSTADAPVFPIMESISGPSESEVGVSWGGNLALLCAMIGTPAHVDLTDKLLFIEDVGEATYRIDRMMEQLRQTGELDRAKGLVVADFTGRNDPEEEWFDAFWREFAQRLQCPVWKGLPVGHGDTNWMLPLGVQSKIVDNRWTMVGTGDDQA